MRALLLGFLLAVGPAGAAEPEDMAMPIGTASCDPDGPNCIVSRATLIASNVALGMAKQRLEQMAAEAKERDQVIADLKEALADELAKRPRCAKVEKVPVPGNRS